MDQSNVKALISSVLGVCEGFVSSVVDKHVDEIVLAVGKGS